LIIKIGLKYPAIVLLEDKTKERAERTGLYIGAPRNEISNCKPKTVLYIGIGDGFDALLALMSGKCEKYSWELTHIFHQMETGVRIIWHCWN